jgi:hypothetical protein
MNKERYGTDLVCCTAGDGSHLLFSTLNFDDDESEDRVICHNYEEAIHLDLIPAGNLDANMPI